jgi:predicted RecA/RadA family phage recombinase
MAKNALRERGDRMAVACTDPAVPLSGQPVRFGDMCGVALIDERADGLTTVHFKGVYKLLVGGTVAAGDTLYYHDSSGESPTPVTAQAINGTATGGTRFGYAMEAGTDAEIAVRLGY